MMSPENNVLCKMCMAYHLERGEICTCTGKDNHCHVHDDLTPCFKRHRDAWKEIVATEDAAAQWGPTSFWDAYFAYQKQKKQEEALEAAARAYNKGEGFMVIAPWGSSFTFENHSFDLKVVREKAWAIR